VHPVEAADEGVLAAARGADDGGHLAGLDAERYTVEHALVAVRLLVQARQPP
jgi:hypothetical protein